MKDVEQGWPDKLGQGMLTKGKSALQNANGNVAGVPGIKPTDGTTAWEQDGKDVGNRCPPAFWSSPAAAPQGTD